MYSYFFLSQLWVLPPPTALPAPSQDTEQEYETEDAPDSPDTETHHEQLTIRIPGRYLPHAPRLQQQPEPKSPRGDSEEPPTSPRGDDENDNLPQYVVHVHQFPAQSTPSSFVRNTGGSGTPLAFRAFEGLDPAFAPTLTTPDP